MAGTFFLITTLLFIDARFPDVLLADFLLLLHPLIKNIIDSNIDKQKESD
jgi:hypothetical protein